MRVPRTMAQLFWFISRCYHMQCCEMEWSSTTLQSSSATQSSISSNTPSKVIISKHWMYTQTIHFKWRQLVSGCKSKIWLRAELVDIEFRTQFEAQFRLEADAATVKPTEPIQVKIEERTVKSDSQVSSTYSVYLLLWFLLDSVKRVG